MDEFALIAEVLRPLVTHTPAARALADDAALLPAAPEGLVATLDTMVAGVHFLPDDPPALVARKLVRVNLSDLAAKGATPRYLLLSLGLGPAADAAWVRAFADGLATDLARFSVALVGGDTVSTPGPTTLSLTALGTPPATGMVPRDGGRPGHRVAVSGTLGDGALGLRAARGDLSVLSPAHQATLAWRYRLPHPRVPLGEALAGVVSAMMDLSDGLPGDLGHLTRASGLGARVDPLALPLSPAAQAAVAADPALWPVVVAGGDDYELLFTYAPEAEEVLQAHATACGVRVTPVGALIQAPPGTVVDPQGVALAGGWRHRWASE